MSDEPRKIRRLPHGARRSDRLLPAEAADLFARGWIIPGAGVADDALVEAFRAWAIEWDTLYSEAALRDLLRADGLQCVAGVWQGVTVRADAHD